MFSKMITKLSKWVVLALCFSIYYRMLINTLKIKKGENLYFVQNKKQKILLEYIGMNLTISSQHRPKNRCYEIYYTAFGGIQKSRVPCYC